MTADNLNFMALIHLLFSLGHAATGIRPSNVSGHPTSSTLKKLVSCRVINGTLTPKTPCPIPHFAGSQRPLQVGLSLTSNHQGHEMTSIEDQNGYQNKLGTVKNRKFLTFF